MFCFFPMGCQRWADNVAGFAGFSSCLGCLWNGWVDGSDWLSAENVGMRVSGLLPSLHMSAPVACANGVTHPGANKRRPLLMHKKHSANNFAELWNTQHGIKPKTPLIRFRTNN